MYICREQPSTYVDGAWGRIAPQTPLNLRKTKYKNDLFFITTLKYINVHMGIPQTPNQLMKKKNNETEKKTETYERLIASS